MPRALLHRRAMSIILPLDFSTLSQRESARRLRRLLPGRLIDDYTSAFRGSFKLGSKQRAAKCAIGFRPAVVDAARRLRHAITRRSPEISVFASMNAAYRSPLTSPPHRCYRWRLSRRDIVDIILMTLDYLHASRFLLSCRLRGPIVAD